jgi:hypothetical protein
MFCVIKVTANKPLELFLRTKKSEMNEFVKKYKWKIVGTAIGAVAGYAYYYYIGCTSGTCPIQSHWQSSTLYGALLGYVFVNSPKKDKSKENSAQITEAEK